MTNQLTRFGLGLLFAVTSVASSALASPPRISVDYSFRYDVISMPNDSQRYPEENPQDDLKKLIMLSWYVEVKTQDPTIDIEDLKVIAYGKTGSKQLVTLRTPVGQQFPEYTQSGQIPIRCFTDASQSLRFTIDVALRKNNDDGSIDRESQPRHYEARHMPPFVPLRDRHTGPLTDLCTRK